MECFKRLQETVQKSISTSEYTSWIATLSFDKIDLETLYLNAPTRFIADWVKRNYFSHLYSALTEISDTIKEIKINVATATLKPQIIKEELTQAQNTLLTIETSLPPQRNALSPISTKLSEKLNFDTFIKDSSNTLAFEAVKRISTQETITFNPLLIHSPSGFGKTHLLNALSNELINTGSRKQVIYISADKFMYSYVKAMQERDTHRLIQSFKSADILIIDDIQFIANKPKMAEELFHIINDYIINNKQVVIASNSSPLLIEGLDKNLKSRIASGVILDILPATFDLRLQIVKEKSKSLDLHLEAGIGEFIASKITTSIRELEGAINRISANTVLMNEIPTLSNIRKILADLLTINSKPLNIQDIKKIVAEKWNVSISDIDGERKQNSIVIPRQVAMYIAKNLTSKSLPEIGRNFGGRNHATVIYAVKKVREMMITNPQLENLINETEQAISSL